ncbi:hypothetical protein GCM10011506_35090 [Marivirga lumbricoides]|uniref:DUF4303 domain-containing protein n=1 Tax=Marivirga lumbricoides TaxID=1046115 RepID=A0ABQ1MT99_9BACT|nr:hypothetical protein GCM10011506_35090 [Marivirga lumbricoides]
MYSIPDEVKKEYKLLATVFDKVTNSVLEDNQLTRIYSKFNLYEIEPFYAELSNQVIDLNQELFFTSETDFNPETDDLYEYHINMETRKVYFKRLILGPETSYETVYEYNEDYYKSSTTFINSEGRKAIKLCYLYHNEGIAHWYYECTDYGLIHKSYRTEGDKLTGYQLKTADTNYSASVDFIYEEDQLTKIIQNNASGNKLLLYVANLQNENKADILTKLEDYLTEQIADQVLKNAHIDEPVYCLLLEYSMQHPFPPTVALGLVSELEDDFEQVEIWQRYNAPDMHYFSEDDSLKVDLYSETIQSAYLFTDKYTEDISWNDEDQHEAWEKEVFQVYLNVCKRLLHFDFSACFPKSPHFLVMAREFEQCNEEDFYKQLSAYKKNNEI